MYRTREENARYMREYRAGKRRRQDAAALSAHLSKMESALQQIRALNNYPGEGRINFGDLARVRREINKLACDALREEG